VQRALAVHPGVWFGDARKPGGGWRLTSTAPRWWLEVDQYGFAVVADHPDRLGFFATLTLPDVRHRRRVTDFLPPNGPAAEDLLLTLDVIRLMFS
jgi:hypothetical protein